MMSLHGINYDVTGVNYDVTGINYDVTGINYDVTGVNYDVTGVNYDVTGVRGEHRTKAIETPSLLLLAGSKFKPNHLHQYR